MSLDTKALLDKTLSDRRRAGWLRLIDRLILVAVLLAIWEVVVDIGWVAPFMVSRPWLIARDLYQMFSTGYIFPHLFATIYEAAVGLIIGTILGMLTGFLAALFPRLSDAIQPILVAFNSMPRVAVAPLFIVWFGFDYTSKIALAAMVVYFVVFFNTFSGMRSIDPVLQNSVRVMGASRFRVLQYVSVPHTLAWIFAAMNTSISLALVAAVIGEFVGATQGMGWIMVQASSTMNTTRLFSAMIILSVIGTVLFFATSRLEAAVLGWRPSREVQ
ncbi:MAG TPA: ABC transporter permease [Devosiaceae bacterium]|jgi:NitT/TauT family transport system permease protein